MSDHAAEVARGERFQFGENWSRFLTLLDESRIRQAEISLQQMLATDRLTGQRFLDIGSGSGLFSLAARRLGATVHSFDYDPQSVACTRELRQRYCADDPHWIVEQGSALDGSYLATLGTFDVVYSWGVLHHTGAMWQALELVAACVAPGGRLYLALYNDQGSASRTWTRIKRAYCRLPAPLKFLILYPAFVRLWIKSTLYDLLRGRPFYTWRRHADVRGMSPWRDVVDWVGGYPFEVARPEQIFDFYRARSFVLEQLKTCGGGRGCNEYVFRKNSA